MESVEWCSVDEVKCLLSYLTGEKKINLDNIQQVPVVVKWLVHFLFSYSRFTIESHFFTINTAQLQT